MAARHPDSAASHPADHVAMVAGRPISMARLEQRIGEVRRGPRGRHLPPGNVSESIRFGRWIVQELVTEEVLAHEARAAGLIAPEAGLDGVSDRGTAPGEDRTTAPALTRAALDALVERVTASVTVARRDLRAYYVRNRDLYRRPEARRVRQFLLPDEHSARQVASHLAAGDQPAAGAVADVHRGEFTGPLEDAIFAADAGAVVGPIASEFGWHVARIDAVTPPSTVPYAEARPGIEAELLAAERTRAFGTWLEARRTALAVIEPGFEHPADPVHGFPSHRH